MGGVCPWKSRNKIAQLSRNQLDYLNKIKWEESIQGNRFLTCNLTNYINIVQEKTFIAAWRAPVREANSTDAHRYLGQYTYLGAE